MNAHRCLYCYQPLEANETDFHPTCSKKFFGNPIPPILDYGNEQMQELAKEIVVRSIAVTGVQPKLSLTIEKASGDPKKSRFTIVGLWGNYILKPPTPAFHQLPENEDLTMHLSEQFGLLTAEHSLIRLKSGELAYITKRFDREGKEKLPMEDMCQLTETLTNDKYKSSMEKIAKCITQYSSKPGLDMIAFFETTLFCFITGNADMHLKNFSLLTNRRNEVILSPAYDLLCTKIAMPDDKEELALTLNGKKRKLRIADFDRFAENLKLNNKAKLNIYEKASKKIPELLNWIGVSFLSDELKEEYRKVIEINRDALGL